MRIHSLDIAGSLKNWNPGEYRGHFTDRETGRVLSPEEFRWQLIDRLALGEKHLQLDPECKTFDPATGCLGCPAPEPAPASPPVAKMRPLGITPRWLADEHRAEELILAIGRYRDAGAWPDTAWAEELAETLGRINRRTPLPDGPMPHGVPPRSDVERRRAEELAAAIGRYDEGGFPPDAAWAEELAELRHRLDGEPAKKLKIVTEPSVYLVGRQEIDEAELRRFLADHQVPTWTTDTEVAGEKLVEVAGRLCYLSFRAPRPGGNAAYLGHILDVGHGSVLEHAVFNLIFTGVSRSFTHELVRHRAGWGYSQLSQRFVDESDCEFVEPDAIAADPELHAIWLGAVEQSQAAYRVLSGRLARNFLAVDYDEWERSLPPDTLSNGFQAWLGEQSQEAKTARRKRAREAARSVLPNATETKIFVTANARALRHFIDMRADPAADVEIRKVAVAVLRLLQREAPNLFGDYELHDLPDGGQAARTAHRKV